MTEAREAAIEAAARAFEPGWWPEGDRPPILENHPGQAATYQERLRRGVRAAISAYEAALWRPIEEAPTNTSVLIWLPDAEHYGPGIYRAILVDMKSGRHWQATTVAMGRDLSPDDWPKKWRPLPTQPERGGDE